MNSAKKSVEGKTKELEEELNEKLSQLEEEFAQKREDLEVQYKNSKDSLQSDFAKKAEDVLGDIKKTEKEVVDLTTEAYKKAIFAEFDRKRSTDVYNAQDSKMLNELKNFIENNEFLDKTHAEKIDKLFSGKISIDELMYELS